MAQAERHGADSTDQDYLQPADHTLGTGWDLHDVIEGRLTEDLPDDIQEWPSTEFAGFHLCPQLGGDLVVQPDGYVGEVGLIDPDDFDDVLELAVRLQRVSVEFWHEADEDERREWAGPVMTSDPEKGAQEGYIHAPRDPTAE